MLVNLIRTSAFTALVTLAGLVQADVITSVTFEDGAGVGYTTSDGEFNDGGADYFTRTDSAGVPGNYLGSQGSFFFAAQDIDAEGGPIEQSVLITGIDITDFTDLTLDLLVAEDDATNGDEDWDRTDFFDVFASIDGGAQQLIFSIRSDESSGTFNGSARVDTNFDGLGDGTEIVETFANFQSVIAGTGTTLDLEFQFRLDSGDEDLAIDNIVVQGVNAAIPEPGSVAVLSLISLALIGKRRRI
ncbi:MAG: hypothetical protein AAF939_11585 [Planctomycetota bacterium]